MGKKKTMRNDAIRTRLAERGIEERDVAEDVK